MAEVRKRKRRIILIALCTVIVLAGASAGVLIWENRMERQFPEWTTPCRAPDEKDINPEVSLRFAGIDFEVPLDNGELRDRILIKAKSDSIDGCSGGPLAWVDYWYEGEWHTVWCNGMFMLSSDSYRFSKSVDGGGYEGLIRQYVPVGLFARDGSIACSRMDLAIATSTLSGSIR